MNLGKCDCCKTPLSNDLNSYFYDCGGTCLICMASCEDPECMESCLELSKTVPLPKRRERELQEIFDTLARGENENG